MQAASVLGGLWPLGQFLFDIVAQKASRPGFGLAHAHGGEKRLLGRGGAGRQDLGDLHDQLIVAQLVDHLENVDRQLVAQFLGQSHIRAFDLPCRFGQPPLHVIGDIADHGVHMRLFEEVVGAFDLLMGDRDALLFMQL
eukprot:TRINITY_DN63934_c0_g1_i1.p1 TRINITY_DN63934_c0_g1~~TRINITY_DN63934_c0_g1_i1.p1  ORF type:complete len:139 (+),score=6.78 TRINITY_DN63934_c0_g1_i1:1-417(+)